MANEKEGKNFWVWAQVEESLHTALLEISTTMGKHPRVVIEMAIEQFVTQWAEERHEQGMYIPPKVALEKIMLEERSRQVQLNQLRQLAYNHAQNPTDDTADQLALACELVGISVESVLEQASDKGHVVEVLREQGSLNSAEQFLLEVMVPGEVYAANELLDSAAQKGIKGYLIKEAKRKLKIKSRRYKDHWGWSLPDRQARAAPDGNREAAIF